MDGPSPKLLVVKTWHVDRLRAFYKSLGIALAAERHGSGSFHYAGRIWEAMRGIQPPTSTGTLSAKREGLWLNWLIFPLLKRLAL
jgi:hypothetical protein